MTVTSTTFDATARQQFEDAGFVVLPGFFGRPVVEVARRGLNRLVDEHAARLIDLGVISDPLTGVPFERRLLDLYQTCLDDAPDFFRAELHLPELFSIFFDQRLLDIAETLLGTELRLYPNYTVRAKLPNHAQTLLLWHQDGGYTEHWHKSVDGDVDEFRMINAWTPLVPATVDNGCMQFLPGTHRIGLLPHEQREFYLEIPAEQIEPLLPTAVDVEVEPGDLVLFHNMLCHRGLPNLSKAIRWSMDWRYQDATQPTLRDEHGHLARSSLHPDRVVRDADDWAARSFN